jgi:hypothetical protein
LESVLARRACGESTATIRDVLGFRNPRHGRFRLDIAFPDRALLRRNVAARHTTPRHAAPPVMRRSRILSPVFREEFFYREDLMHLYDELFTSGKKSS